MHLPVATAVHDLSPRMVCLAHCDRWLPLHGRAATNPDGEAVSVVGIPHAAAFPGRDAARWASVHAAAREGKHQFCLDDELVQLDGEPVAVAWWMLPLVHHGVLRGTIFLAVQRDAPESAMIVELLAEQRLRRPLAEILR